MVRSRSAGLRQTEQTYAGDTGNEPAKAPQDMQAVLCGACHRGVKAGRDYACCWVFSVALKDFLNSSTAAVRFFSVSSLRSFVSRIVLRISG